MYFSRHSFFETSISLIDGMSWEALRYGVHTTYSEDHPDYLVYNPSGGLGFLDGFIIDAHFRYDILIII